jgi:polyisoprenoid-binding protein YceI
MASTTTATGTAPILPTGTWEIDPVHSLVEFTARHLMVSKVRGRFTRFGGTIIVPDDPLASSVTATIEMASVDTANEQRDEHLRSPDFFDVERFPTMDFVSRSVRPDGDDYVLTGDLTLHGVTRPIDLHLEFNGTSSDPWGGTRVGFSATTELNRRAFGIDINLPLDGGGVVVGDKVRVELEIEAVLASAV